MRCGRCGRENVKGARFCTYCHGLLSPPVSSVQVSPVEAKAQKNDAKSLILILIGILSVVFLSMVIALTVSLTYDGGDDYYAMGSGSSGAGDYAYEQKSSGRGVFLYASQLDFETGADEMMVYFYAQTENLDQTVNLVDSNGEIVVQMLDDGSYENSGDDFKNDGIYTAKLTIDVEAEGAYYYTAQMKGTSKKSNEIKLTVIAPFTQKEISDNKIVDDEMSKLRNDAGFSLMSHDKKEEAVVERLNELADKGLVDKDSIYVDKNRNVVTYYYTSGIMAGELIADFADEENIYSSNYISSVNAPVKNGSGYVGDAAFLYATDDESSSRYPIVKALVQDWNDRGLETSLDSNVTIDDLKNLSGLDFVCIDAHGAYCTFTYVYEQQSKWFAGSKKTKSKTVTAPAVFVLEKTSSEKDEKYAADLKSGRVVKLGENYGVVPAFFDKYYDGTDISDSIFYFTSCQFMGAYGKTNYDWSDILETKNVDAVIGYHNSVYAAYVYDKLDVFVPDIISGMTVGDAFEHATQLFGDDDATWCKITGASFAPHPDKAYPILKGDRHAVLFDTTLKNGDFEEDASVAVGWNTTGDVRILTTLGEIVPESASRMSILTTGVGSGESTYLGSTEGSSLYQTVRVPEKHHILRFSYNVVSEEPMEYVDSKYDDKFYMEVLNSNGEVLVTAAGETVNTSKWIEVEGVDFAGGDNTAYQTGWNDISCDLSEYEGEMVTLKFVVFDVGDSIYDTAVVIDNVRFK